MADTKQTNEVIHAASALQIQNDDDYEKAGAILQAIKRWQKHIKAESEPTVKAAYAAYQAARELMTKYLKPLDNAELTLKTKMGQYSRAMEQQRRAEAERLIEEARQQAVEQQRLEQEEALATAIEAEALGDERGAHQAMVEAEEIAAAPVVPVMPDLPAKPKAIGVSTRKRWTWRIVSELEVPRQYLVPDKRAIGRIVRALGPDARIPGVEIYEDTTVAVRA